MRGKKRSTSSYLLTSHFLPTKDPSSLVSSILLLLKMGLDDFMLDRAVRNAIFFFQIQTLCFTFRLTLFFQQRKKHAGLLSWHLYLSFHSCHFESPNPSGWNFTFVTGTSKSGKFMMEAFKKGPPRCTKKGLDSRHLQTNYRHCPLRHTEVYKSPSLVKQSEYPLTMGRAFFSTSQILTTRSCHGNLKCPTFLGSLRSFKFFKKSDSDGVI